MAFNTDWMKEKLSENVAGTVEGKIKQCINKVFQPQNQHNDIVLR